MILIFMNFKWKFSLSSFWWYSIFHCEEKQPVEIDILPFSFWNCLTGKYLVRSEPISIDYWVGNSHFECKKFSVLFCSFIVMKSRRPTIYPKSMLSSAFNIHQRCCPIFHNTLFLAKLVVMFVSEPVQLDGFLRKYVPLWHNYVVCNWICSFMWGKFHDFGIPQGNAFQRIKAHISFNCKQTENTLGKYSVIYGDFVIKYAKWWFLHTEK